MKNWRASLEGTVIHPISDPCSDLIAKTFNMFCVAWKDCVFAALYRLVFESDASISIPKAKLFPKLYKLISQHILLFGECDSLDRSVKEDPIFLECLTSILAPGPQNF